MPRKKGKVFVAMSGGVDSSVAAALLKRDGFDVVGVYMKCWAEDNFLSSAGSLGGAPAEPLKTAQAPTYNCTSQDDERSARLAAGHLGIPFYTWNFLKEYRERVVNYMLQGYAEGITPNPDMMCNKEIKFGLFFEKAMRLGADFIATGHYARLRMGTSSPVLVEAVDKNKDQSYFLSFIKPEVFSRVLFPIGEYTKPQVRELARKFELPNAERKDSQGICFVGKVDVSDFLKHYIAPRKGEIVDAAGQVLGTHEGSVYYTIGQRSGLGLSGGPYYVVNKDLAQNRIVVTKDERDLQRSNAFLQDVNWMCAQPVEPLEVLARIRYRQDPVAATLMPEKDNAFRLVFQEPQRAVTPGQFAVLYQQETLIGGGVIQ